MDLSDELNGSGMFLWDHSMSCFTRKIAACSMVMYFLGQCISYRADQRLTDMPWKTRISISGSVIILSKHMSVTASVIQIKCSYMLY